MSIIPLFGGPVPPPAAAAAAAAAKLLQLCLTLCDPIDGSPPGFPVSGILQARTFLQKCIEIINVKFIYIIGFPVFPWVTPNQLLLNCFSRVRLYVTP